MRTILTSFGGKATQDQIAQALMPEVFNETEWKRWWDSTKKELKKDGHFSLPAKKGEPLLLRQEAVSRNDELLAHFASARQLKDQLIALDAIIKNLDAFPDPAPLAAGGGRGRGGRAQEPEAARPGLLRAAPGAQRNLREDRPSARTPSPPPWCRCCATRKSGSARSFPRSARPSKSASSPPSPRPSARSGSPKALKLMLRSPARVVAEIARLLQEQNRHAELKREIDRFIRDHSLSTEVLYWLCKERNTNAFNDLIMPSVFSAIITALEREQLGALRPGGRMHDLIMEDRELIPELLSGAEIATVRECMRKLILTPVFEELNKRSLLGRIVRAYPEMQAMLEGDTSNEKQEALIVSWESLERRKEEYEDLIKKKIPENTREIAIARDHGDLRENFEFKAAKEMQRVLQRRQSEMENALSRARGTDFANADTNQVSIGTIVTYRVLETGQTETYTLLGAWDGQPEKGILSYQSGIGQALLGKKIGDHAELPSEGPPQKVEIVSIEAYHAEAVAG